MDYLYKIYYKNKNKREEVYQKRINNEISLITNLKIKSRGEEYPLYFIPNIKSENKMDKIRKNDYVLMDLKKKLPPDVGQYLLIDAIASELQSSNELEGVNSTKEEIIYSTNRMLAKEDNKKERFNSTINSYLLLIEKKLSLPESCKDIRKIYDKIIDGEVSKEDLPDGKIFRKDSVHVKKQGTVSGEIIHSGIDGEDNIIKDLEEMLFFLNNEKIPLLLKVAICHYYFEYVHPFYDGNGRTGRFLSSIYLENQYSYLTALSLSRGSYLEKAKYYKAFDKTNNSINKGELNFFVDTFLNMLIKGQEEMIENLIDKNDKIDSLIEKIENDNNIPKEIEKVTLVGFLPSALFLSNPPFSRKEIIKMLSRERFPENRIKETLKKLAELDYIDVVNKRPLSYKISERYLLKNLY
ncbi:Fic family protein [Anaerococcus porci]|uniref:Fic family protein n=1 Tax=Anaerococcus porci TaxID=2652269 RepID=UPI002A756EB1|nr:Fic family protein [Anaerococcus porci]MDY3006272.1 Fic family protein [Anaerococcus porci]